MSDGARPSDTARLSAALARLVSEPEGRRTLSRVEAALDADAKPPPSGAALAKRALRRSAAPASIGIWEPSEDADGLCFLRNDGAPSAPWYPPTPALVPKRSLLPLKVCLLGESAATGWFFAPEVTLAGAVETALSASSALPGAYQVDDLSVIDLSMRGLLELAAQSLQLRPDVVVIFAGNNWVPRAPCFPELGRVQARAAGAALERGGVPALAALVEEWTLAAAKRSLDALGHVFAHGDVEVVWVVPEVNLSDWSRDRPVAWCPGDGNARWHALHAQARGELEARSFGRLAETAARMIELDGGVNATSQRLLAVAQWESGNPTLARQAARNAVRARAFDNAPGTPSITLPLQELLRTSAREHGHALVDLAELFGAEDARLGRELFLDYCHPTLAGLGLAARAIAEKVVSLCEGRRAEPPSLTKPGERSAEPKQAPPAEVLGRAYFQTALSSLHFEPAKESARALARHWLGRAFDTWPGVAELARLYLETRVAPAWLERVSLAAQQLARAFDASGNGAATSRAAQLGPPEALDPNTLRELLQGLVERAAIDAGFEEAFTQRLIEQHGLSREGVDLASRFFRSWVADGRDEAGAFGHSEEGFFRARWPESEFGFVTDASSELRIDACVRLPPGPGSEARAGPLCVEINAVCVFELELQTSWQEKTFLVPRERLRRGLNDVTLRWPKLGSAGGAALAHASARLRAALPADLHPVFGEVFTFHARLA